ncbi:MAG: DNA-directed RNA polymerase subunit sigma24 [Planctomycetota bacterium]|nr:MAG: DNA-directed RNA polymerase subunit sigma24 [Planctomycetota bacterium]
MLTEDSAVTEVTAWLRKLEAGHDLAAQRLWDVFFERLVRLAQERMRTTDRRVADAEDVALSAFASFCRGVENQRFPELTDRQGLWRLLVSITIRKLLHLQRDQSRLKRGGGFRTVESLDDDRAAVDELISREPTPEFAAQVAEEYQRWMSALDDDELTRLAEWKLEGFTNDEVAAKTGRSVRTVERKLNLIRKILIHELPREAM